MSAWRGGDVDYDRAGQGYAAARRTDPRIEALVHRALGDARSVLNVGAGAGSYEPTDREVTAVEPSAVMRAQRPAHLSPAIDAVAESLPFPDRSFDAGMAMVTVHQWADKAKGLREMRRVVRGPIVVLTFDGDAMDRFWLADYVPEMIAAERGRMPAIAAIGEALGGEVQSLVAPIPRDCVDGFTEAYYARPERFLDPEVRRGQSAWRFVTDEVQARFARDLERDLGSGDWSRRYGEWKAMPVFEGSLRLVVSRPSA